MTKTKIALAAVIFAVTGSAAFASYYDPNLANRYPGYANPNAYGYSASGKLGVIEAPAAIHSTQVELKRHGNVLLSVPVLQQREVAPPTTGAAASTDWFSIEQSDRASSSYAGGN